MSWGDLVMCRFPLKIFNVRRFICKTKRYISSLPNPLAGATTAYSGGKQRPIAQIECCKFPNYTQSCKNPNLSKTYRVIGDKVRGRPGAQCCARPYFQICRCCCLRLRPVRTKKRWRQQGGKRHDTKVCFMRHV